MAQITPPFPCTNRHYGLDDTQTSNSWWWTTHEEVPPQWRVVCLYPVHPDGLIEKEENYVMPDLGKTSIYHLSNEAKQRAEFLIARYGAENMVSLAMGNKAEQYGYKPYERALADTDIVFKREVLVEAFSKNLDNAMQKYGHLFEQTDEMGLPNGDKPTKDKSKTLGL